MTDYNFPGAQSPSAAERAADQAAISAGDMPARKLPEYPDPNTVKWYAQPDDLIGGWCICNVDKPPSRHNRFKAEFQVADFTTEATARRIVALHNKDLGFEE